MASPETTGSGSAETRDVASAIAPSDATDCQEQTWPYIARPCLANEKGKRGVRVISTDKLAAPVISVVETPPDTVANRRVVSPAPAKAQAVPPPATVASNSKSSASDPSTLKSGASLGAVAIKEAAKPAPTEQAVVQPEAAKQVETVAAPTPAVAQAKPEPVMQAVLPAADTQVAPEKKASREAAIDKSKRKAKRQEADRIRTATAQSDDDDDQPVAETRNGKIKGRIVERWTERDYTVPSYEGTGARRVVVIGRDGRSTERSAYTSGERRGGFPNIFGSIFGEDD